MQLQKFIEVLSKPRIKTYLDLGCSEENVVEIYRINLEMSSSFYILLHGLELTLRNKIHNQLSNSIGENWLLSGKILLIDQLNLVNKAQMRIKNDGKEAIIPRIIAALPFSFWEHLFSSKYEDLWRKHLHKIFEQPPKKFSRKEFHKHIIPIRKLRNRIAHYECILNYPIQRNYEEIVKCTKWLCPEIAEWTVKINNVDQLLKKYKQSLGELNAYADR